MAEEPPGEGYHLLPGTLQSPTRPEPVDRSRWRECESCGRLVPVVEDRRLRPDGTLEELATCTYVCPFCRHCHEGAPGRHAGNLAEQLAPGSAGARLRAGQKTCHECGADLADAAGTSGSALSRTEGATQCPGCSFPKGWMTVGCPYCGNPQPVFAPHWHDGCDMFTLECVKCGSRFCSLCIC